MLFKVSRYGWLPDLPDHRDRLYAAPMEIAGALPAKADLRAQCPPVYDQSQLGSCTANAIAGAIQFDRMKQMLSPVFTPSRLFIYYNERAMEHSIGSDSGAQIRDGIKSVNTKGVCPEKLLPYDPSKFTQKPSPDCYKVALNNKVTSYQRLTQDLNQMKGCLADGFPFVFGFTCYESFESDAVAKSGILPMPKPKEKSVGGHAIMCVGFDDSKQVFIIRNSWGTSWGQKGYFTMPYAYATSNNLSDDFWTIRIVEEA